ncbi:MAG: DUF3440 domain-containing protein, partial [Halanaerobiales bacterium]|nr:DUF3440 domain-containing protein [Halanaerobiales bacterium]
KEDLWVRDMPDNEDVITRNDIEGFRQEDNHNHSSASGLIMPHDKKIGIMLGIRAQESLTRYRAVARREEDNYFIKMRDKTAGPEHYKVYPIYDWTTNDVWTAPKKLGWDYNEYYDVLDKMGIKPHSQRVSNPFGAEPVKQLTIHNELFPEDWNDMVGRVPGVSTARRWATTELYSHKKLPQKPDDMSWEEFLTHFIKKYDKKTQKKLAKMIKQYIKLHYKKTNQPILPETPHPESGVSWKLLLRKVIKGDLKDRNQAQAGTHDREKYEQALREWKDENTASK